MYERLSLEEKVELALKNSQRALAYQEIQKLWAAHAYCYRAQQQRYELDNFWATEHDDIMYAHADKAYVGRELVYEYYAGGNEQMNAGKLEIMSALFPGEIENIADNLGIGDLVVRLQATPYIEIAQDNLSAKGVWYTLGLVSEINAAGKSVSSLLLAKECVDFVYESGGWRIWHFRDASDLMIPLPESALTGDLGHLEGRTVKGSFPPMNRELEPFAESGLFSAKRVAKFAPELPRPYDSWSEDISWAKPRE